MIENPKDATLDPENVKAVLADLAFTHGPTSPLGRLAVVLEALFDDLGLGDPDLPEPERSERLSPPPEVRS